MPKGQNMQPPMTPEQRVARDITIVSKARAADADYGLIAREHSLTMERVRQIAGAAGVLPPLKRKGSLVSNKKAGRGGESTKTEILALIIKMPGIDADSTAKAIGTSYHDVAHLIHELGRAGLVTFHVNVSGRHKKIDSIHPTKAALRTNGHAPTGQEPPAPVAVKEDTTETLPVNAPEPALPAAGAVLPDGGGILLPDAPDYARDPVVPDERINWRSKIDMSEYPQLVELLALDRAEAPIREAARLLEAAGKEDLALQVLESVPSLTEREREMISFLRKLP